jgi:hypothetical protein
MLLLPEGQGGEKSDSSKKHVESYVEKPLNNTNTKSCV